jgi:hypothetical protein
MHAVEILVSEPSPLEVEIAAEKVKMYTSTDVAQIPAELILVGRKTCL